LITTSPNKKYLDIIKSFNVPFVVNQSREQIAKILGQSKTFFFPSYNESCPLVIYEALNSGCNIVSRDVGATVEQLGNEGHIFINDNQCINLLEKSLEEKYNESKTIQRGLYFDKIN
jgi:glycosyltransferase involved in cell wall biosynthesis